MQNYGMPGGPGPHGAGGGQGQQYPGGMPGGPPAQGIAPTPIPQPGISPHQYRAQLVAYQHHQTSMLNLAHQRGQFTQQQLSQQLHMLNERIRNTYGGYVASVNQQGQMQHQRFAAQGGAPQGEWAGHHGSMPPPQMAPSGPMTNAEKKKMAENQRKNLLAAQQQQQQQQGLRFPPGTTPQQQQQIMRMHQMQQQQLQQQQQQQSGSFGRMMPMQPGQNQQFSMMNHAGGMQPLQHVPPSGPQSHGPASVSNAAQQQFHQQQYYQQQQNQQQQMHMQQMQQNHQQMQQGMQPGHEGFQPGQPGQMHPQQQQAMMMQQQQQQQAQQSQQQQQAAMQSQKPAEPPRVKTPQSEEDKRYNELLKEMKDQYLDILRTLIQRQHSQKGMVQMVNVLEGRRILPYEQLIALKSSLCRLMVRDCPTFPVLEELRKKMFKTEEERDNAESIDFGDKEMVSSNVDKALKRLRELKKSDPLGVEPWSSLKHLEIRVPDWVRKLTQYDGSPSALEAKRRELKRERGEDPDKSTDDVEDNAKKIKEEGAETVTEIEEDPSLVPDRFKIRTVFDNNKCWVIPPKAREELSAFFDWNVDEVSLPSCSSSPFVVLCLRARAGHLSPLSIRLPRNYPMSPVTVQFDRSFPQELEYGPTLQKLFEKNLCMKGSVKSLTDFVDAYYAATEEYCQFLPKDQNDSSPETSNQKTPEIAYASHYATRPADQNPIAHKGMVM